MPPLSDCAGGPRPPKGLAPPPPPPRPLRPPQTQRLVTVAVAIGIAVVVVFDLDKHAVRVDFLGRDLLR